MFIAMGPILPAITTLIIAASVLLLTPLLLYRRAHDGTVRPGRGSRNEDRELLQGFDGLEEEVRRALTPDPGAAPDRRRLWGSIFVSAVLIVVPSYSDGARSRPACIVQKLSFEVTGRRPYGGGKEQLP